MRLSPAMRSSRHQPQEHSSGWKTTGWFQYKTGLKQAKLNKTWQRMQTCAKLERKWMLQQTQKSGITVASEWEAGGKTQVTTELMVMIYSCCCWYPGALCIVTLNSFYVFHRLKNDCFMLDKNNTKTLKTVSMLVKNISSLRKVWP